jgi:hypothetical protein
MRGSKRVHVVFRNARVLQGSTEVKRGALFLHKGEREALFVF